MNFLKLKIQNKSLVHENQTLIKENRRLKTDLAFQIKNNIDTKASFFTTEQAYRESLQEKEKTISALQDQLTIWKHMYSDLLSKTEKQRSEKNENV